MEFKSEQRAKEYAKGKSSSEVFTENHERDFLAGYNKALEDSEAKAMLELLKLTLLELESGGKKHWEIYSMIESLIEPPNQHNEELYEDQEPIF